MESHVTLRVKRSWLRLALVIAVTAAIVAPVAVFASHQFTDVPDSNIFHDDIAWMADEGITFGCNPPTNDQFCPKDFVTREQLAAFMHRMGAIRNYEVVSQSTASNSEGLKSLIVDCPAGMVAIGGGARIFGSINDTSLTANGPEGPVGAPTSWFGNAIEGDDTANSWGLRVDVFCADV